MAQRRIQYNTNAGKAWRIKASRFYNAKHELADYINEHKTIIERIRQGIATDEEDLLKIELGKAGVLRTKEAIELDKKLQTENLELELKALEKAREAADEQCAELANTVTDALYNSFVESVKTNDDAKFNKGLAKYLVDAGFDTATPDNVPILRFGTTKESSKGSYKTGNLTKIMKKAQWTEMFCRTLVDILAQQKAIDIYKYAYKLPERKKSSK